MSVEKQARIANVKEQSKNGNSSGLNADNRAWYWRGNNHGEYNC